jgi:hypothetical protein
MPSRRREATGHQRRLRNGAPGATAEEERVEATRQGGQSNRRSKRAQAGRSRSRRRGREGGSGGRFCAPCVVFTDTEPSGVDEAVADARQWGQGTVRQTAPQGRPGKGRRGAKLELGTWRVCAPVRHAPVVAARFSRVLGCSWGFLCGAALRAERAARRHAGNPAFASHSWMGHPPNGASALPCRCFESLRARTA